MQRIQIRDGHRLGMQTSQVSDEDTDYRCKGHRLWMRTQIMDAKDTD